MIAILGATGTIGLSLAYEFASDARGLSLFTRSPERLRSIAFGAEVAGYPLDQFSAANFELIINAIGAGDPRQVAAMGPTILDLTDRWDRRVLDTIARGAHYVFLSSGAVHRGDASPYVEAKQTAEARHRSLPNVSILDLRVFGYADITLPRDGSFFLSDLARSVGARTPFKTSTADMVRDYVSRIELSSLIRCWEAKGASNIALDIYSKASVRKSEILEFAKARYGIAVQYFEEFTSASSSAAIDYVPLNRAAATVGYNPERTSLEIVVAYLDEVSASGRFAPAS